MPETLRKVIYTRQMINEDGETYTLDPKDKTGWFHQFLDSINSLYAIIETESGAIETIPVKYVRFAEPPDV